MGSTEIIDLRSDTVTVPCAAMRRAMAEAEVGDDVIDVDPTVARLEATIAERLGKEAALFVPSGTMANQIAVRLHCRAGEELICESTSHVYFFEQGAYAQLSGVVAKTLVGDRGVLETGQFEGAVWPSDEHFPRTRLVWIENTHNMGGGTVQPFDTLVQISRWARGRNLALHMDGARLFNAVVASGRGADEWAGLFDTVSVCFSKGLGAPVGSALVGPRELMAEARRHRKLFGGGMRQAGIIAAGALYALEHNVADLEADHAKARRIAQAVAESPHLTLVNGPVETNIVYFRLEGITLRAAELVDRLEKAGVRLLYVDETIRAVTHRDVSMAQVETALSRLTRILDDASRGGR